MGGPPAIYEYTYDDNNNLIERSSFYGVELQDIEITRYAYENRRNATNRFEKVFIDFGGDGTTDRISRSVYAIQGNIKSLPEDFNADGVVGSTTRYTYQCQR